MEFPSTQATLHTLPNGLKVILDPDLSGNAAPVISTQIWVETGSIHEGEYMGAGLSHLLEHMVFKGTKSFSGEELSQTVQAAGGQWNAYTTFDRTVYYIDGPSESAETFLKALTEMVFTPTFPEDEYEKEKDVIRREIDMGLDDPDGRASRLLFSTALANDGRSQPVIGHLELFNLVTHEIMTGYHASRYTTENAFVSISGDFQVEEMLETLKTLTAEVPRSFLKPVSPSYESTQLGKRVASENFAVPVTKLNMAWQTVGLEHPDGAVLDLLSTILGGGRSSRLYQSIREKQNLCLHIGSWSWVTQTSPGLFSISAEVETDKVDALIYAIHQEIETLTHAQLDAELAKAKRQCLSSQFRTLTTASGRASDLASNFHESRNLNFTADYLKTINEVNEADIRRVCMEYLIADDKLTVTTLNPETTEQIEAPNISTQKQRDISTATLSNGLTLLLCPDRRTPTVSIRSAIRAGLPSETIATAGVSSLLSTLLSKGTKERSGEEMATSLESLGASISAAGGNNTSLVSASCLTPDTETVLDLFAETFTSPALHQENIDHERQVQLTALLEQDEDPVSLAFRTLKESLFCKQGYGINGVGNTESLDKMSRLGLYAHHSLYYNSANSAVAIFGDIEPDEITKLAEKHLSRIPSGERYAYPEQKFNQGEEINLTLDKQQAIITLGYEGAQVGHEHQYSLDLLHAWCADMAGPLFTRIREELGLAYFCSATQFHGANSGFFGFYLGTSPDQLDLAQKELGNTIDDIVTKGIDAKTLESVKTSWLAKQALTNQSNAAMAQLCAIDSVLDLSPLNHRLTAEKIKQVTISDIKQAAEHFFTAKPTTVIVKP